MIRERLMQVADRGQNVIFVAGKRLDLQERVFLKSGGLSRSLSEPVVAMALTVVVASACPFSVRASIVKRLGPFLAKIENVPRESVSGS